MARNRMPVPDVDHVIPVDIDMVRLLEWLGAELRVRRKRCRQGSTRGSGHACLHCHLRFRDRKAVKQHLQSGACRNYTPPEVLIFQCTHEGCEKLFLGKKSLIVLHQTLTQHTGLRKFWYSFESFDEENEELPPPSPSPSPSPSSSPMEMEMDVSMTGHDADSSSLDVVLDPSSAVAPTSVNQSFSAFSSSGQGLTFSATNTLSAHLSPGNNGPSNYPSAFGNTSMSLLSPLSLPSLSIEAFDQPSSSTNLHGYGAQSGFRTTHDNNQRQERMCTCSTCLRGDQPAPGPSTYERDCMSSQYPGLGSAFGSGSAYKDPMASKKI